MEQNPIELNESDLIRVLDNDESLVQILGVTPGTDDSELEVMSVELDEGASFLIDIDDIPYEEAIAPDAIGNDQEEVVDGFDSVDSFDSPGMA